MKKMTTRKFSAQDIAISMITFVGSRGKEGATYYEWWRWFTEKFGDASNPYQAMEYRGTGTARWYELENTKVLLKTSARRQNSEASPRQAAVFILRPGATIIDWSSAGPSVRRGREKSDEQAILAAYRSIQACWPGASEAARERLLIKLLETVRQQLRNKRAAVAAADRAMTGLRSPKPSSRARGLSRTARHDARRTAARSAVGSRPASRSDGRSA